MSAYNFSNVTCITIFKMDILRNLWVSCISMFQIYIVEIFRTLVEEEHALIKASIRPDLLPGVKFSGGFLVPAYTPLVQAACSSTLRLLPGAKCSGVSGGHLPLHRLPPRWLCTSHTGPHRHHYHHISQPPCHYNPHRFLISLISTECFCDWSHPCVWVSPCPSTTCLDLCSNCFLSLLLNCTVSPTYIFFTFHILTSPPHIFVDMSFWKINFLSSPCSTHSCHPLPPLCYFPPLYAPAVCLVVFLFKKCTAAPIWTCIPIF